MTRSDAALLGLVSVLSAGLGLLLYAGFRVQEDGVIENAQVLLLALAAAVAVHRAAARPGERFRPAYASAGGVIAWVLLEEVSYGQRIFGFASPAFFHTHNLQGETNLHNFAQGVVEYGFAALCLAAGVLFVADRRGLVRVTGRYLPAVSGVKLLVVLGVLVAWVLAKYALDAFAALAHITAADLDEMVEVCLYAVFLYLLALKPSALR